MRNITRTGYATLGSWLLLGTCSSVYAEQQQSSEAMEVVEVVGTTPSGALSVDKDLLPVRVQALTEKDIARAQATDMADLLNRKLLGVTVNMAQNNPLQGDLQYRGYTASPLLGLPQGMTVYLNGVRSNEPFGDTLNWELIPLSAVSKVELMGGSNPVFGLNTLGGAIAVKTKTGFDWQGIGGSVASGSFGRSKGHLEAGGVAGDNEEWGYYLNLEHFNEDGWRPNSKSYTQQLFSTVSHRTDRNILDVNLQLAKTKLRGNGPSPVELIEEERNAVFTSPDITSNELFALTLEDEYRLSDSETISSNVYWRRLDTVSFNGDGTEFEECDSGDDEFLVEEFEDVDGDDECDAEVDTDIEYVYDQHGDRADGDFNAINNLGNIRQNSYGGSLQYNSDLERWGQRHQSVAGVGYYKAEAEFDAKVELSSLLDDRSTTRTGIFPEGASTALDSETNTYSIYASDTITLDPQLHLTVGGRYNFTRIELMDRSGERPDLNGKHKFSRLNTSLGLAYEASDSVNLFANASQSSRNPTPIELACADPEFECRLPNAFLADPPLEQVIVTNFEAGARGQLGENSGFNLSLYHATNVDDIIFMSTGGAMANTGYFDNIDKTRRIGADVSLEGQLGALAWSVDYSYLEATFESAFNAASPNHPLAGDNEKTPVTKGDRLPGLPRHSLKLATDYQFNDRLRVGLEMSYRSSTYLRGDEANLLDPIGSFTLVNASGSYQINEQLLLTVHVDNLFDKEYATFGLLGEPDEVLGDDYENPIFNSVGAPRAAWVGLQWQFK